MLSSCIYFRPCICLGIQNSFFFTPTYWILIHLCSILITDFSPVTFCPSQRVMACFNDHGSCLVDGRCCSAGQADAQDFLRSAQGRRIWASYWKVKTSDPMRISLYIKLRHCSSLDYYSISPLSKKFNGNCINEFLHMLRSWYAVTETCLAFTVFK